MHFNNTFTLIELKNFIENAELRKNKILKNLDWSEEFTIKEFNSNSKGKNNIDNHKIDSKNDPMYPENFKQLHSITLKSSDFYEIFGKNNDNCSKKLPNKFSDMQTQYDREEKLQIYNYVIEKTGHLTETEKISLFSKEKNSNSNIPMNFDEMVAFRRHLKRRKLKHKLGKEPPLSITEEYRSLIELSMNALQEYYVNLSPKANKDAVQKSYKITNKTKLDKKRDLNGNKKEDRNKKHSKKSKKKLLGDQSKYENKNIGNSNKLRKSKKKKDSKLKKHKKSK